MLPIKNMVRLQYRIVPREYFISATRTSLGYPQLLLDRSDMFTRRNVSAHFNESYQLLIAQLEYLKTLPRPLTLLEEKEIQFMLQTLLSAHFIMHEMHDEPSSCEDSTQPEKM